MSRPRLLDLFCGAGGAAMGYHRAGFEVVGVDIAPQKRYPFRFVQADALAYVREHGHEFDAIHASPPCQRYSALRSRHGDRDYPDLVAPTRDALNAAGLPWVIENVPGAPLLSPMLLCGTMFGLVTESGELWRHRLFETSWPCAVLTPPCHHTARPIRCYGGGGLYSRNPPPRRVVGISGHTGGRELRRAGCTPRSGIEERRAVMGIAWMTRDELSQAIPPAYTEFIGRFLLTEAISRAS